MYHITDRDFEDFYALMEKIESDSKLAYGNGPVVNQKYVLEELRRNYRYYFIGWRNRMMGGDTYFRGPDPPRDDTHKYIRAEIDRLQRLLPKADPQIATDS